VRLLQLYRQGGDQAWLLDMKAWEEEGMLDDAHLQPLRYILGSAERRIVGHGITTFDAPWVWEHFRIRFARLADTLTAHRLIVGGRKITKTDNPELQGGLDRVLRFYLGFEYPSDLGASDWGVEQLDDAQLEYAEHDVLHLHELLFRMEELIRLDRLQKAWGLEQRLAPVVVDMTNRGVPFDREGAIAAYQAVKPRLEAAEKAVRDWFGLPSLNLNSGPQLMAALNGKGINVPDHKAETLVRAAEMLPEELAQGIELLLGYNYIRDKEDKFLVGLVEAVRPDGRIRAVFNPTGAKSGRFSCRGPNLQQIPRLDSKHAEAFPVRSLFRAPPGYKLVIGDFSQMEILICGVLCEPKFLQALQEGHCAHCETGTVIFKREVTRDDDEERRTAKFWNFGSLYGSTSDGLWSRARFKNGIDISREEAAAFYRRFFSYYRGLAAYQARAKKQANLDSVVEVRTLVIERRMWLDGTWWNRYTSLLNQPIQGSGAEMQKISMIEADEQLRGKAELLNCIHDELILLCRTEDAELVKEKLTGIMEDASAFILSDRVRIPAEVRIVDSWADKKDRVFARVPMPEAIVYQPVRRTQQARKGPANGDCSGYGLSQRAVEKLHDAAREAGNEITLSRLEWPSAIAAFRPTLGLERKYQWKRQRHAIWEYRQRGVPRPEWKGDIDPYLLANSFCNVWRVLDGISQRTVTIARNAKSFDEQLPQVLMLKTFNEWPTYEVICEIIGAIPTADNLDADSLWAGLLKARQIGRLKRLWRPSYTTGGKGLETIFRSSVAVIKEGGAEKLLKCNSLYEVVAALRSYPGLGPFHATQFTLDLAYGSFLRGNLEDFCISGIGAAKGVALAFAPRAWSGAEVADVIRLLHAHQEACYALVTGEKAPRLQGRGLFPMDVQSAFCETQKLLLRSAQQAYTGSGGKQDPPLLPVWW
jgi:DNA polymerase-1